MDPVNCHPEFKRLQREVRLLRDQMNRINKQPNKLGDRMGERLGDRMCEMSGARMGERSGERSGHSNRYSRHRVTEHRITWNRVTEQRKSKEYFDSCNERWAGEVRARLSEIKELRKENHKLKSQIKNGIYEMRCSKCCKVLSDEIPGWHTAPDSFQYCDKCEM